MPSRRRSSPGGHTIQELMMLERQKPTELSRSHRASLGRESNSFKDVQSLSQEKMCDPWPVTKLGCRKDSILEAAQVLVRERNTELVNQCSNAITLLPASGAVSGVQGGSREKSLYSLRSPTIEPFKIHLWQIPAVRTWNETKGSWDVTAGKIMVRRGLKSEPFIHLLKCFGVAKCKAKMSDLCKHFRCWRFLNTNDGWLDEYPRHLRALVYQRWWSFNGFRFLELPLELREMVLIFAMGPTALPFDGWPAYLYHGLESPNMALSLVSKQLNHEVIATLLAHTTFCFHFMFQFLKFFRNRDGKSRVISPPIKGPRSLVIDLSPDNLFRLFGISSIFGESSLAHDPSTLFNGEIPLCHRISIRIPHVFEHHPRPKPTSCQKIHNLAFWAGARAHLRNIAVVDLVGHIDETQKREWLAEHALERKGVVPEPNDFAGWQRGIWTYW